MPKPRRTHCQDCGIELTAVNEVWASSTSRYASCRECFRNRRKDYYASISTPESNRRTFLKRTYKMTPEEYNEMYEFQQFGCAICRKPSDKLNIDHNHTTDEVRGLLCQKCNIIVGFVETSEDLVLDAIEYLKRTTWLKQKVG